MASVLWSGSANAGQIGYCHAIIGNDYYFTRVVDLPENTEYVSVHLMFERFVERQIGKSPREARCDAFATRDEAEQTRSRFTQNLASRGTMLTIMGNFPPDPRQMDLSSGWPPRAAPPREAQATPPKPAEPRVDTEKARAEARAAREARERAAQERYEIELAAQQRQVQDYARAQEEIARKKVEQQAAASQALAAHQTRMAEHQARLAANEALLKRYDAEQRRHNACIGGNPQACADIAAGKPVGEARVAEAGKASTDTDANRCVTSAELRQDDTYKGNTAAYVVNGCGQPVDVRICLMREAGGWNCGATSGLAPQGRWSHSSFQATGRVFVDARVSGSGKPLASPN